MDNGSVAGVGKHEDLSENCPLYAEMLAAQDAVDNWEIKANFGCGGDA
jgi:ABC-type transport system involved in cytochrome bd biosynthesis fused ATPase/permease subunit